MTNAMKTQDSLPVDRMWTRADLATYFQYHQKTLARKVLTQPTFPPALSIDGGQERWDPAQVKEWAKQQAAATEART